MALRDCSSKKKLNKQSAVQVECAPLPSYGRVSKNSTNNLPPVTH